LVARVKAQPASSTKQIDLQVDVAKLHVFEPGAHGDNLTLAK
jgi:hypothetical protein